MRVSVCPILAAIGILAGAAAAHAQTGPVIVIPGKPGVPVMMNGAIIDGAIVYGDWGLARPGHGEIVVEGIVTPATAYDARGYYPMTGRAPRYGRLEIDPKKTRRRAQSFHREWSTQSNFDAPVTVYPPFNPPEVIEVPRQWRRR